MTHVKARAWIKRLPEGRGQPLDAGAKLILMELWDRVDWSRESDSPARDCYPCRRRLAEDTGTTPETVKSRLARLAGAGWIRREGDGWALAWARPWPVESGDGCPAPGDPSPGGSVPRPRVIQAPPPGDASPDPGGSKPRISSPNQVNDQPHDHVRAEAPTPQAQPPDPVAEPAASDLPTSAKRKPRASRRPPPAQGALGLDGTAPSDGEPAVVEALLAEHDRLRRAALERHGDSVTGLPKDGTRGRAAMVRGCRQALRERGEGWCRDMLAWAGARWLADASQLAWSTTSVWTGPSCANAAKRMGGPARASPRRSASMLSAPLPSGPAPEFTLDESENETCELI